MFKKVLIAGLVFVVVAGIFLAGKKFTNNQEDSSLILYWGDACPHCEEVRQFIQSQKMAEKMPLVEKEVYTNSQNNQELLRVAKNCGLPTDSIAAPLLYAQHRCFVGTTEIISYLSGRVK